MYHIVTLLFLPSSFWYKKKLRKEKIIKMYMNFLWTSLLCYYLPHISAAFFLFACARKKVLMKSIFSFLYNALCFVIFIISFHIILSSYSFPFSLFSLHFSMEKFVEYKKPHYLFTYKYYIKKYKFVYNSFVLFYPEIQLYFNANFFIKFVSQFQRRLRKSVKKEEDIMVMTLTNWRWKKNKLW